MSHDIIDNRQERLLDHIELILPGTEQAHFAVGYLFLSGLKPIREHLEKLKEIRLLIGNTTNRETLETLAEGYKRLEFLEEAAEKWRYQKRIDMQRSAEETIINLQEAMALMDQTDEDEATVQTVLKLIEEKRLKVRVYTKGRLHAKAYIFDYGTIYDANGKTIPREEKGIAIVGSSNLTLSGISHNTELNVLVHGNNNHAELVTWFDALWNESQDFDEALMTEMKQSWAAATAHPYDIYMKTLYELVKDRLDDAERHEILWDDDITRDLADFQKVAVRQAIQMIRDYGGCFVADVVGLGKSYIGAAVIKHFEHIEHARPLIICPRSLVNMWERYNEFYQLNARVLSMGYLRESEAGGNILLSDIYRERDLVLVDESHNFRHHDTKRYKLMQSFMLTGKRCLFLTATPRNKSAWDVFHQIKLFHPDDITNLPIDPPNLREFFKGIEEGTKRLQDALSHVLIRRTRTHILKWYGFDAETNQPVNPAQWDEYRSGKRRAYVIVSGKHYFFPKRERETITYSIEETYQGLYQQIRHYLGRPRQSQLSPPNDVLTYARYGLWHYVKKEYQNRSPYTELHQAGANLKGLIRILMFKRFEWSVHAFRETLKRLLRIHQDFLKAMEEGIVPAGEEAQDLLYESDRMTESELLDALRQVSGKYNLAHFNVDLLRRHIEQDIRIIKDEMLPLVERIYPAKDAKLQTLIEALHKSPFSEGKCLIFTQYADTAQYLYDNLNPDGKRNDIDVIYSSDKSRERIVGRFAPKANKWYSFRPGETELNTVIATDILAEGLNLQDCDKVINYDLHWNPVRLIQRFGRIDRIGSEHEQIFAYNFLPEIGIEKQLGLRDKLEARIKEIHETIGEDAAILDPSEQLNEEAMYAIYEKDGLQLSLFEESEEEPLDLNEAEEIIRQIRRDKPEEFERIANLRDGIRTGRASSTEGIFAFFRAGRFQQLLLLDSDGNVVSNDLSKILGMLKCSPFEPSQELPEGYNAVLMQAKRRFDEEVKHRIAHQEYTTYLTQAQRYMLRELRAIFNAEKDDNTRSDIMILEEAFRGTITEAVKKELNLLRRNGVIGKALLENLKRIYHQYSLKDATSRIRLDVNDETPKIVCSEALLQ